MIYRYVGASCTIGETNYTRLGEKAEFDDATARTVILGGAAFISEKDFTDLGFTQAECDNHPYKGGYPEPSAELVAKRARAEVIVHESRSQMLTDAGSK